MNLFNSKLYTEEHNPFIYVNQSGYRVRGTARITNKIMLRIPLIVNIPVEPQLHKLQNKLLEIFNDGIKFAIVGNHDGYTAIKTIIVKINGVRRKYDIDVITTTDLKSHYYEAIVLFTNEDDLILAKTML